jgi:hypothetical protein
MPVLPAVVRDGQLLGRKGLLKLRSHMGQSSSDDDHKLRTLARIDVSMGPGALLVAVLAILTNCAKGTERRERERPARRSISDCRTSRDPISQVQSEAPTSRRASVKVNRKGLILSREGVSRYTASDECSQ